MESWLSYFELKCSLLLFILLHYSHSGYSMFFISLSLWQTVIILICLFVLSTSLLSGFLGFPGGSEGKRLPAILETNVWSLGREDPLEKEIATHSSTLVWRIPWMEEPGRLQSTGSQSRTWLSNFTVTFWQCNVSCSCCIFPVPVLEPVISLGNLCFFYWSIVFETKIWTLRVFFSSRPSQWIELGSTWMYQFSSVTQSCPTLCEPMNHSTPGLPVHHKLPESTQTHVHWVGDAI